MTQKLKRTAFFCSLFPISFLLELNYTQGHIFVEEISILRIYRTTGPYWGGMNEKTGRCKIDEKSFLSWTNEKPPGFLSFMEGPGNEKGVRAFTELLRRSYSFILYQW